MINRLLGLKNNRGFVLMSVFLVVSILLTFSVVSISPVISQNNISNIFKRQTQALNVADAGLDRAVMWLRTQGAPPTPGQNITVVTLPLTVDATNNISYSASIIDCGFVTGSTSIRRYRLESTGTSGNMNRILRSYVQVDNYARYIWYTDRETFNGNPVWFWSQDHLNGPTHTNAHYNIYGDPIFDGEARSVDDYIRFYNNGTNVNLSQTTNAPNDEPTFNGGFVFGADQSTMPTTALSLRAAASSTGLYLTGNSTVTLQSNGTMNVTNSSRGWTNQNMALPVNGALFVNNGDLTISGTVNGRLTAGSSRDVIVTNNIVYADDPAVNPASDDTLGLMAENDVVISSSAPTNLEINACIMALNTSFYLDNWSSGGAKGTLTVYGGIIQKERGPVGTFNASTGQKISGYSKNYSYDPRLVSLPPPFMPTTGDYITLSWEEK